MIFYKPLMISMMLAIAFAPSRSDYGCPECGCQLEPTGRGCPRPSCAWYIAANIQPAFL